MTDNAASPRTDNNPSLADALFLLPILAVAAALRVYMVGARSLWIDEGVSAGIARLPWNAMQSVIWRHEANMALYYILLHEWTRLGDSEAWLRGMSMLAAVAAIVVVFILARRMFGRNVAFIAAGLIAFNAYHIQYSQEARSYALLSLAVTITTFLLLRAVESPSSGNWTLFALASALAVYLQFFVVFVTAAQGIGVLLWRRRALKVRPLTLAGVVFAITLIPIIEFIRDNIGQRQLNWVPPVTASGLYAAALSLAGWGGPTLLALTLGFVVWCMAAGGRGWLRGEPDDETFNLGVVTLWLVFPFAITIAVSPWRHLFVPRYMVMTLPALAILVARGVARLRLQWQVPVLVVFAVLLVRGDRAYYAGMSGIGEDWRSATQFILRNAQPGDAVIFNNGIGHPAYAYYAERTEGAVKPRVIYPVHSDDLPELDFAGVPRPKMFPHIIQGVGRLWAVDWMPGASVAPLLNQYFLPVQTTEYLGVRVTLYVACSPACNSRL
ncbi:MAG TPA: glycosyltransferase family 39 protein [Candidatus Acidoferrum sp.]|nr:glycosyltransferase family 39 protein [Candidatus Acidoferrum sp.]